jgi:hypothetical protein
MGNGANDGYIMPFCILPQPVHDTAIFVAPDGLNWGCANNGGEYISFLNNIINVNNSSVL